MGKLDKSEKSEYFELVQKSESNYGTKKIIKALKYFDNDTKKNYYLGEIDAEAMLVTWKTSLFGFSKIKLLESKRSFSANSMYFKFDGENSLNIKDSTNYSGDTRFLKTILDTISKNKNFDRNDIDNALKHNNIK